MSLKHLTSKLLAGGLTAGIVLIWWPRHYPTDGLEWLVLRGIVATLGFELMLLAYAPMEDRIVSRLSRRFGTGRLRARVEAVPAPARAGGSLLFAGGALALPLMLLLSAGAPPAEREEAQPVRVVREIVVKRQVVRDETVVPSSATGAVPDAETRAPTVSPPAPVVSRTDSVPNSTATGRKATAGRAPTAQADRGAGSFDAGEQTATPPAAETVAPAPEAPAAEPETSASPTPAPPVDADAATAAAEPQPAG